MVIRQSKTVPKIETICSVTGYGLLLLWIVSTYIHFTHDRLAVVFWFCNIAVAVIAVAALQHNTTILYFFLAHAVLFQTPWVLDWMSYYISGISVFGLSSYYANTSLYITTLTFIRHTLSIPAAVFLLYFLKPVTIRKKHIVYWFLAVALLIGISILLPLRENVNCVFHHCVPFLATSSLYTYWILWFVLITIVPLITLYVIIQPLHKLIWKYKKSHQNKSAAESKSK